MRTLHFLIISVFIISVVCIIIPLPIASSDDFGGGPERFPKPDLTTRSLTLSDTFNQTYTNSTKDLYLEFFDAKTNTPIQNVSFFINATKDDKVLMHELFYTQTGFMIIKFSPSKNMGEFTIHGTNEPALGGWMSENGVLPITTSTFAEKGTYHIYFEIISLDYVNELVDQHNPPTFDSWWSVDDNGNISKYDNNTIVNSLDIGKHPVVGKIQSPLKQFQQDDIFGYEVQCNEGFVVVIKKVDSSPACVKPDTVKKLVEHGWGESTVKTDWFEYRELDGIKPPWDTYSGGMPSSPGYYVKNYFKQNAITILDAKLTFAYTNGNESDIFFLVSHDDADKMMKLGFKAVSSPPSNTHFCSSINGC